MKEIERVLAEFDQHIAEGRERFLADRQARILADMAPMTLCQVRERVEGLLMAAADANHMRR